MRRIAAALAFTAAAPALAEPITAYWRLAPLDPSGPMTAGFDAPFFRQRMLPVKLVRLTAPAIPAGSADAVPIGTFLYEVINGSGKKGYCTLKDRSAKNQAKSLFIPALDRRPCFVDRDGDGRFDASFSVFEAYTQLSPPQPRGSIDGAQPMAVPADYIDSDPTAFPVEMTISYKLIAGKAFDKTRMRVTVDRPGRSEFVDLRGSTLSEGYVLGALGTLVFVKASAEGRAEIETRTPPELYVYATDNGTIAVPALPRAGLR